MGTESIQALKSVSLEIFESEFLAIQGASGSGKSTLLYILGLLDQPTSGDYFLLGQATKDLDSNHKAQLRNQLMGFVFQSFHLLPRCNALRNVAMPLIYSASYGQALSSKEIEYRACAALDKVGLGDRKLHQPNELSGGQRQRVAIARAIVNKPKLILADEPTGNLDSKTGEDIMNIFSDLNKEGVSIILVTHDSTVAKRAKKTLNMKDGAVEFIREN
jgi:putative ABC transport system ATP-binding protein